MNELGKWTAAVLLFALPGCGRAVDDTASAAGANGSGVGGETASGGKTSHPSDEGASGADAGAGGSEEGIGPEGALILERQIDWLLIDGDRLYWLADPDRFERCLKNDCKHTMVSYPNATEIPAVADGHVYMRPPGAIFTCPSSGRSAAIELVSPTINGSISAGGDSVYRSEGDTIQRCRFSGCDGSEGRG